MAADSEFTPVVRRLGCLRGVGTLTGFALAVEIGDWHRFTGNTIGSFVGLVPSEHSSGTVPRPRSDHQDRQQPRPPAAGRGRLAPPRPLRGRQDHARAVGAGHPRRPGSAATRATGACTSAGPVHRPPQDAHRSPTSPSPANWPAGAGPWPCSRSSRPTICFVDHGRLVAARGATREATMSNRHQRATLDPRQADPLQPKPVLR